MDTTVAFPPEIHGDPGVHEKALVTLEDLKTQPQGYAVCMDLLTNGSSYDDTVKHFCLNIIKNYLKHDYKTVSEQERHPVHAFLIKYINVLQTHDRFDSKNVRYVAARIFVLVFLADYLRHWDDYFSVIVHSMSMGLKTVDHTVRVLHMISFWLSKGDIPPCTNFDVKEKEFMKVQFEKNDLGKIIKFLYFVMLEYAQINVESLKILFELMTWVDASCFTCSPVLEAIAESMEVKRTEDLAMNCFIQLTRSRASAPIRKYELVEKVVFLAETHWKRMHQGAIKRDLYHKYCEFHNESGKQLIASYETALSEGSYCDAQTILKCVETRCSELFTVLNTYDHTVVLTVVEFPTLYVKLLSKFEKPTAEQKAQVKQLLGTCLTQMKCPFYMDIYNVAKYEEFREYRTKVSQLFRAIIDFDTNLVTTCIGDQVDRFSLVQFKYSREPFNDIELSIYLLQILCETIPMTVELSTKYSLLKMIQILVQSELDTHVHPAVVIQYFSTIVAGAEFFTIYPLMVPHVLDSFLVLSGINHQHDVVREHCSYLFYQVVKRLQFQLSKNTLYILEHVNPHLVIDVRERKGQLYLYASTTLAIQIGELPAGKRQAHHEQLLASPFNRFRAAMSQWYAATTDTYREQLAATIRHIVDIVTYTTYAFLDHTMLAKSDCTRNYINVFGLIQHGLHLVSADHEIHASMVALIERLIIILEDQLIPFLPSITQGLCSSNDTECVSETIRILILIIDKYHRKIVPFLQEEFQRIGHCIYLPYAIAYNSTRDLRHRNRFMADLEEKYILYVRSLIRNDIFDEVFMQVDKSPLLNILYMIACGCLPTLKVNEGKMKEYARFLQCEERALEKEMRVVVTEVKGLFDDAPLAR